MIQITTTKIPSPEMNNAHWIHTLSSTDQTYAYERPNLLKTFDNPNLHISDRISRISFH